MGCILIHISKYFTFFESLSFSLINIVGSLIMSAKLATLGLLKMKVVWNKGYGVITFVHGVTNKSFSRDSKYVKDVVMWPKFDNSGISMREITITSIL